MFVRGRTMAMMSQKGFPVFLFFLTFLAFLSETCVRPVPRPVPPPVASPGDPGASTPRAALFDRLGGNPAITAVVESMLRRAGRDPRISSRFLNVDMAHLKTQLIEQVCAASGGPCRYTGKDMKTAHAGLNITGEEFDALVEDLSAALAEFKVPAREQGDLIGLLAPAKGDIVKAPEPGTLVASGRPMPAPSMAGSARTTSTTATEDSTGSVSERTAGLREAATLLDKADAERRRGNRSLADQLFSFAELIVGADAVAPLAPLFREGAPPRINTALGSAPRTAPPQPTTVGNSDEEEPPVRPAKGSLTGVVKLGTEDADGFAVMTLEPASGRFRRHAPRRRVIEQRNREFAPRVLVLPVGSTVAFPNFDNVYHNVFSRSETKAFDLGLYKAGQEREITFDHEGVVRIGCSLHANMSATVAVVSAPHYAVTDARGRFTFKNLDPGKYKLRAYAERFEEPVTQPITIAPDRNTVTVVLPVGARMGPLPDKFGVPRGPKTAR